MYIYICSAYICKYILCEYILSILICVYIYIFLSFFLFFLSFFSFFLSFKRIFKWIFERFSKICEKPFKNVFFMKKCFKNEMFLGQIIAKPSFLNYFFAKKWFRCCFAIPGPGGRRAEQSSREGTKTRLDTPWSRVASRAHARTQRKHKHETRLPGWRCHKGLNPPNLRWPDVIL